MKNKITVTVLFILVFVALYSNPKILMSIKHNVILKTTTAENISFTLNDFVFPDIVHGLFVFSHPFSDAAIFVNYLKIDINENINTEPTGNEVNREVYRTKINGKEAISIISLNNKGQLIHHIRYPDENTTITYAGTKNDFKYFKKTFESITVRLKYNLSTAKNNRD